MRVFLLGASILTMQVIGTYHCLATGSIIQGVAGTLALWCLSSHGMDYCLQQRHLGEAAQKAGGCCK